jgi:hypothetical protein
MLRMLRKHYDGTKQPYVPDAATHLPASAIEL